MRALSHDHSASEELKQLVDEDKLDELLARVALEEIADAWRCYHERAKAGEYVDQEDPDWWAVEFWLSNGLAFRREQVARAGLLVLVEAVGEELLSYVGAGPLENFVDSVEERICWIEQAAKRDPRFRRALASVELGSEEDWVAVRLQRAAEAQRRQERGPEG
jgi:hypothetical protein